MLTRKQIEEIVAFDRVKRLNGQYDGRRYGSRTGAHRPDFTESWGEVKHPGGIDGVPQTRKTLRYNYIVPNRKPAKGETRVGVVVYHVAVRLDRADRPVVKDVGHIHVDRAEGEFRDLGYRGMGGWIVYWNNEDFMNKGLRARTCPPALGTWETWKSTRIGMLTFPWHEVVNPGALKGTMYEWCQWSPELCRLGLVDWLRLYNREPRIELLAKWKADPAEYMRYLGYARHAGLDMRCEGVLYPPVGDGETSFHARLERLEEQYDRAERARRRRRQRRERAEAEKRRRELADLMAARIQEIAAFQKSLDRSGVVDLGCGVKVLLAKSQDELLEEGKRMHNCVGMGHYGEGIVRGNTIIVMFRAAGGRSFCDAEIDRRNWSVRQCYFAHNTPPTEEYRTAAAKIAEHLKKLAAARRRAGKAAKTAERRSA